MAGAKRFSQSMRNYIIRILGLARETKSETANVVEKQSAKHDVASDLGKLPEQVC